jgi:hypothetical protein
MSKQGHPRTASVRLERLEGRLVPAMIAVGTFADAVVPGDGVFSLREAVSRANALPGPDTIVLRPGRVRRLHQPGPQPHRGRRRHH